MSGGDRPRYEDRERVTAVDFARQLATYMSDASSIRALTWREFGRSPTLSDIEGYLAEQRRQTQPRKVPEPIDDDAFDWQPKGLVPKAPKRTPGIIINLPRIKDYIRLEPSVPMRVAVQPENPFVGKFNLGGRLIESVGFDFGFIPAEILGDGRQAHLIDARAVVAKLLRERGKSYPIIGRILGGRDHSTAINAIAKFDYYLKRNPLAAASYQRHIALMEEADREAAEAMQDNEVEQAA